MIRLLLQHKDLWRFVCLVAAAGALAFGALQAEAAWTEPDPASVPPSGGTTAAPLNTSGVAQTKEGSLTIENTLESVGSAGIQTNNPLTVSGNLRISPDGGGQICLNGECRSSFDQDFPDYLHLSPDSPDSGFIWLGDPAATEEGYLQIAATGPIGLYGIAGNPSIRDTYGLFGVAGMNAAPGTPMSAGLFGQAGSDSDLSIGIGGTTLVPSWANAYAAYFKGKVNIVGCMRFNGGDCLSAWPGIAGSGDYVRLLEAGDPAQSGNVHLSPTSTSAFTSLILGSDPSGLDIGITCGDGICNNGETAGTCEADCFAITNLQVTGITDGSAFVSWETGIPATSLVRYGISESLESQVDDPSYVASHGITLSSLNNDTVYYYQVTSISESGSVRTSGIQTFRTLIDTTPPSAPTNLHTTTPSPDRVPLVWYHARLDNPGGVGFAYFHIYRDGLLLDQTANSYYEDIYIDQDATYAYTVKAVDLRGNESAASNEFVATVPISCTTDNDCINPLYPVCCGEIGCYASCGGAGGGGSSPVVLKNQNYTEYVPPGEWEEGGGWF